MLILKREVCCKYFSFWNNIYIYIKKVYFYAFGIVMKNYMSYIKNSFVYTGVPLKIL